MVLPDAKSTDFSVGHERLSVPRASSCEALCDDEVQAAASRPAHGFSIGSRVEVCSATSKFPSGEQFRLFQGRVGVIGAFDEDGDIVVSFANPAGINVFNPGELRRRSDQVPQG